MDKNTVMFTDKKQRSSRRRGTPLGPRDADSDMKSETVLGVAAESFCLRTPKHSLLENDRVVFVKKPIKKKLKIILDREGSDKDLNIVIVGREKGDYLLDMEMINKASSTRGRVKIWGVAENGANVLVRGMVKIEKDLVKIDDFLEIRLLVLDDKSSAEAEPQLEIESDDVKASHAATVSKIDEEQIFYLQSRGIGRQKAGDLIVEGFLGI